MTAVGSLMMNIGYVSPEKSGIQFHIFEINTFKLNLSKPDKQVKLTCLSSSVKSDRLAGWMHFVLSLRGRYDRSNLPKDRGLLRRSFLAPRNDNQDIANFGQPLN
jgi:hypothetical protein